MSPHRPPLPPPPQPTKIFFDPFNSSSTGHQRAQNRLSGSTSWRDSRSYKLSNQFKDTSGRGGTKYLADQVGAGSEHFGKDGRKDNGDWEKGAPGLRGKGWQDIRGILGGSKKRSHDSLGIGDRDFDAKRPKSATSEADASNSEDPSILTGVSRREATEEQSRRVMQAEKESDSSEQPPQIFHNLTIYLNGSTAPLIGDLRLKQLFAQHGGNTSIALGRRTVTHVIIGNTCGGGLASGMIQKEIRTVGGKGIKFVTAQWVLDSVEKGVRQPEARYAPDRLENRIGGHGQSSVRNVFKPKG